MSSARKGALQPVLIAAIGGIVALALVAFLMFHRKRQPVILKGAVIQQGADPQKQVPIAGVAITATQGGIIAAAKSDFSGFFQLALPSEFRKGQSITLEFRNPDYWPLTLKQIITDRLYIVRMQATHPEAVIKPSRPQIEVANVSVRYSIQTETEANIGTAAKMFEVQNVGNVPCDHSSPCSPDGKWKASVNSTALDAGESNVFKNARLSCIAGPCPFTTIDSDHFSKGGRNISVSVRDWSETTTFLLEAEVFHPQISDLIRESYPVILGRSMNFTLPAAAQGVSLQAEIGGKSIIFPLGPKPFLSWADCETKTEKNQTESFRCELKAGYRFR